MKRKNKGITLIALIITIIVLLILAGVTLNMVMGESGIFSKAQIAKENTRKANIQEVIKLTILDKNTELYGENEDTILNAIKEVLPDRLAQIGEKDVELRDIQDGEFDVTVDKYVFKATIYGVKEEGEIKDNTDTDIPEEDIELQEGEIKITLTPEEEWTNQNVKVKIELNTDKVENPQILYKIGDQEDWKEYTTQIEVEKNCVVLVMVQGTNGKTTETAIDIAKIDKLLPKEFTPTVQVATESTISVKAETTDTEKIIEDDGCSGIQGYRFSIDGTSWSEWQESGEYIFTGLNASQSYTIKVEAKDKAGNITPGSTTGTTADKISKVTLNTNGGQILSGNITEYVEGKGATLPTESQMYFPANSAYKFDGWYTHSAYAGTRVYEIESTEKGDKTYYAKWVIQIAASIKPTTPGYSEGYVLNGCNKIYIEGQVSMTNDFGKIELYGEKQGSTTKTLIRTITETSPMTFYVDAEVSEYSKVYILVAASTGSLSDRVVYSIKGEI